MPQRKRNLTLRTKRCKIKDWVMENLKKPETVIGLINTAALLGVCVYFYKKTNNLELELNKHSENLTRTVKQIKETFIYKKHIANISDELKKQNFSMGQFSQDINRLKEVVKIQAAQINEMQSLFSELKTKNPELKEVKEVKLKENAALRGVQNPVVPPLGYNNGNMGGFNNGGGYPQLPQPQPSPQFPLQTPDYYPQPATFGGNNNGFANQRPMNQPLQPQPMQPMNNNQFPPQSPMNQPDQLLDFTMPSPGGYNNGGGFNNGGGNMNNGGGGFNNGGMNGYNNGGFNNGGNMNNGGFNNGGMNNMNGAFNNNGGMNNMNGGFNGGGNMGGGYNNGGMNMGNMNDMDSSEDDAINMVRAARQRNQENPFQ